MARGIMPVGGIIGRRGLLGLCSVALAGLLPVPAEAAGSLRIGTRGGRTRLVLQLGSRRHVAWRLAALNRPPRLVLDLPGLAWHGPARLRGVGLVAEARRQGTGQAQQLILTLTGPVAPPEVTAQAGRLIIELQRGPAEGFARLADGRPLATAPAPKGPLPLVVLDPGHGGHDPGAIGTKRTLEKRITLAVALELKRRLEAAGRCRVLLTRSRDVFVPLGDRIELARKREAALFLSLHADSAPGARGASVYTLSERASDAMSAALADRENRADRAGGRRFPSVPPEVQRILLSLMRQETRVGSDKLARLVVDSLDGEVPLLPNTHRRAGFVVLKAPDVPSVLVEMGFLSHPEDEAALNRPAHRAKLATALAEAVHGFLDTRSQVVAQAQGD